MRKIPFLPSIFIFAAGLAVFHIIATHLHLYYTETFIDVPSHIVGGIVTALIFWAAAVYLNVEAVIRHQRISTLLFVIFVGVLWEMFELHYHITSFGGPGYFSDTLSDLFCDVVGGIFAYYYFVQPRYGRE